MILLLLAAAVEAGMTPSAIRMATAYRPAGLTATNTRAMSAGNERGRAAA